MFRFGQVRDKYGRTWKRRFLDSRFHLWLISWKPIPLCWLFEKYNKPIPRYFIGHSTMTLSVVGYRFREDDGSETGATWIAAQNTAWSPTISANRRFRLRVEIQESGGSTGTSNAQIQYSINGVTWQTADPLTIGVHTASSTFVSEGTATTNQLTVGTGTFAAGQIRGTLTAATASMAASGHTEHEFILELDYGYFNSGDVVTFRVLESGALITYNVTPQITITKTFNDPPTISPNTADATNFGETTPTLQATATDTSPNDVEYGLQIDTQSNFQGGESLNASFATVTNGYAIRSGNASRVGQAFQATASGRIRRARFFLWKSGAPTVRVVAKLYACTGTLGTTAVATGQPLASSYNSIDSSTLLLTLANGQWCDFYFMDNFSLVSGTNYVIACEVVIGSGFDDVSNIVVVTGSSTGGHAGNYTSYAAGAWNPASANDVGFYVYTGAPAYTSNSSSGTGWLNTITTSDTSPYNTGEMVQHTIQSQLATGTYYWRMAARDPTGSGIWGWSPTATRSFSYTQPMALVRTVGQYRNDTTTPLAVGASTTDGVTNTIYLSAEYSSMTASATVIPKAEVRALASTFTNVPTITGKALIQRQTAATYSARGGNLIHDTLNDRYIFFGGYDGTTRRNEVWSKDMSVPGMPWRKLAPTGTPHPAVNLGGATYVRGTNSSSQEKAFLVLWGGTNGSVEYNDMTYLDITTPYSEAWGTVNQNGTAPLVRNYITRHLVTSPTTPVSTSQSKIWLFGGWGNVRYNELKSCVFDVNTPGSITWTTVKAEGSVGSPSIRGGAIFDYNPNNGCLYLFGGATGTTPTYAADFWKFDPNTLVWTQITPSGTVPAGRELGAGGYDKVNDRFWYSGGWQGATNLNMNDIGYISNVTTGSPAYVQVKVDSGTGAGTNQYYSAHSSSANYIDQKRNYLIVYNPYFIDDFLRYGYLIDLNETDTSDYPVYGLAEGEYLTARDAMAHVWNPDAGHWVVFTGYGNMSDDVSIPTGTHLGDIWTYNPTTNTWRYAVAGHKQLPSIEGATAVYDTTRQRILCFGGLTALHQNHSEVFQLTIDSFGNYVVKRLKPTGTRPTPTWLTAGVYDPINDRAIFALGGPEAGPLNVVWALNFSGGSQGTWAQLTPTGTVTAVIGPGFANDAANKRLYIYGGATDGALATGVTQLVYLDYSTTNCAWTTVSATGGIGRRTPTLAFDPSSSQLIVFGGKASGVAGVSMQALQFFNTTSGTAWTTSATFSSQPGIRRSAVADWFNGKFYIFAGRTDSAGWYNDTWSLVPNYGAPNSSIWTNLSPAIYNPMNFAFTNGTNNTGYHWQTWLSNTANTQDTTKVSYGGNSESSADFVIGTIAVGYNVRLSSMIPFFEP